MKRGKVWALLVVVLCVVMSMGIMLTACRPGYKEVWTPVESYADMANSNINFDTVNADMDLLTSRIRADKIEGEHKRVEEFNKQNEERIANGEEPLEDLNDPVKIYEDLITDADLAGSDDKSKLGTFESIPYDSTDTDYWHPIDHLSKIVQLQIGVNDELSPLYQNEDVKRNINFAMLNWVTVGYYCDWNGWYNDIGVGMRIPDILLFGLDGLTAEQTTALFDNIEATLLYAKPLRFPVKERKVNEGGGNLTDQVMSTMKVALLSVERTKFTAQYGEYGADEPRDYRTLYWLKTLLENELRPFPPYPGPKSHRWDAEGPKEDYSFQQHDQLIYFGGYGEVMVNGLDRYLRYTKDTQFELNAKALNFYAEFLVNGMQFAARNGYRDISASGRGIARRNGLNGIFNNVKEAVGILLNEYGEAHGITKENINALNKVWNDRYATEVDHGAGGHRYFYESDYGVMNNEKYMASVRHASNRTRTFEYLNGENRLGYYTGLGATFFYVDGDEYFNTMPSYNWNMVPGTTTRQGCLPKMHQDESYNSYNNTKYVAGVSNGKVGVSYIRQKSNTIFELGQDKKTNKKKFEKLYTTGVGARKSYFMFEDGVVCLGSDISTILGDEVFTTINQAKWDGDVYVSQNGEDRVLESGNHLSGQFDYIYHDKIGYFIDNDADLSLERDVEGDWKSISVRNKESYIEKSDMFTLYINHGVRPFAQRYAYTMLMNASLEETKAYAANPIYEVVANEKNVQAVYDKKNDVLQAVFHKGGKLVLPTGYTLKLNKGAVVILENVKGAGKLYMTIASNDYKEHKVKISYNGMQEKVTIGKAPTKVEF